MTNNFIQNFQHHNIFDDSKEDKHNFKDKDYRNMSRGTHDSFKSNINTTKDSAKNDKDYLSESFSSNFEAPIDYYTNENGTEASLVTSELDKIILKYGDNPGILQLILTSKVEEDRRRAEEARLKQKELEYILSQKEHNCSNSRCLKENMNYKRKLDKGKDKENPSARESDSKNLLSTTTKIREDNCSGSIKRKTVDIREEIRLVCSPSQSIYNKNNDYFSSTLYSPPHACDESEVLMKRQSNFQQQLLTSPLSDSPLRRASSTFIEDSTPRLQPLDYVTTRQNFLDPSSQLPYRRSSSTGKFNVNDTIPPNTLPPISASLLSSDQYRISAQDTSSIISQSKHSSSLTSTPLKSSRNSIRLQTLPTLDSFETSIMETLQFDNTSDKSSVIEDTNSINRKATTAFSDGNEDIEKHLSYGSSKKKIGNSAQSAGQRIVNDDIRTTSTNLPLNNTKKLLLPPNPSINDQNSKYPPNRTRRRRREMQPITMIIETRDFPYNDDYVWKNNGNTIHKSSGQKSIYYKCSNSNAGCPVNKTVTFRDNGEYLIKYRGSHLDECSKIKRVNLPA